MNMFSSIIFADAYSHKASELVNKRTLASIPFGGRFRLVDFVLSSLVNAGVKNVALIPKRNYASLADHLGDGKYWDLHHRNSGLKILSPFFRADNNNEVFMARGKLDALRSVLPYVESLKEEYIVISNGNLIANIDFESAFKFHIESGADITTVYANSSSCSAQNLELTLNDDGRITDIVYGDGNGDKKNISLNIYIMKRELLIDIIGYADAHDLYSFDKYALINNTQTLKIMGYFHESYAQIIYSTQDYYKASMDLLSQENRTDIFNSKRPVMTRVKDSVPTLYQYNAKISNSLIADGCKIDGTVKNSIIFRNVTVEPGAVIENCVIMQNTVVGRDSKLRCAILDKDTSVSEGKQLCGDTEYPFVLAKNAKI